MVETILIAWGIAWGILVLTCIIVFAGVLIWAKYQEEKMGRKVGRASWHVMWPDLVQTLFMMILSTGGIAGIVVGGYLIFDFLFVLFVGALDAISSVFTAE